MSTETKTDKPKDIACLDDFKKLNLPYGTKMIMVAVSPEEFERFMKWADTSWKHVLRGRAKYDGKTVCSDDLSHKKRPTFKFMAAI